jgi:hypothetical protein
MMNYWAINILYRAIIEKLRAIIQYIQAIIAHVQENNFSSYVSDLPKQDFSEK